MTLSEDIAGQISALEARVVVSETACKHLCELYNVVWGEAFYDSFNDSTKHFADQLWPHIKALNEELKFRK